MAIKFGLDAKLYYKAGGQGGGGAWTELTRARDVTLSLEAGEADVSSRASGGWRATDTTLKDASVEWEMVWDDADAGFAAVRDAFLNRAMLGLQVLDGAGGKGLQADFKITAFTRNEPLEEGLTISVTAKVTHSATPPSWIGG